jgi:hypothetical protein
VGSRRRILRATATTAFCMPRRFATPMPQAFRALHRRRGLAKSGGPERIGLRRAIFRCLRLWPVNRSAPKTPGNLPLSAALGLAESTARMGTGAGRGIRIVGTPSTGRSESDRTDQAAHALVERSQIDPRNHRPQRSCAI